VSLEEAVKGAAPALQALAIAVTAFYASRGLNAWRGQLVGKRKFEVAEEVIVGAHKAKANLLYVRNPLTVAKADSTLRDTYALTFERLQRVSSDIAEFEKTRVLAGVHIGRQASDVIGKILRKFHEVAAAARMLVIHSDRPLPTDEAEKRAELDRRTAWELTIWGSTDPMHDALTKSVEDAIATLEALCRPYLAPPTGLARRIWTTVFGAKSNG
jgi:hypothetical protein